MRKDQHWKHEKPGFGIIELGITLVILAVVLAMTIPMLRAMINIQTGRKEIQRCQDVIMQTASECLALSRAGQISVNGDTIKGEIKEVDGTLTQIATYTLQKGAFGRPTSLATPWLNSGEQGATNYGATGDVIPLNGFGVLSPAAGEPAGGVITYSYEGNASVIEMLQSGLVEVFHNDKGDLSWVQ